MGSPWEWINGLLPYFMIFGVLIWAYLTKDKLDHLEKRIEEIEDHLGTSPGNAQSSLEEKEKP